LIAETETAITDATSLKIETVNSVTLSLQIGPLQAFCDFGQRIIIAYTTFTICCADRPTWSWIILLNVVWRNLFPTWSSNQSRACSDPVTQVLRPAPFAFAQFSLRRLTVTSLSDRTLHASETAISRAADPANFAGYVIVQLVKFKCLLLREQLL